MSVRSILWGAVVVVASGAFDAEKNSKHPLFLWFSYPNNYGEDGTGTYLDAEISFATGNIFQRPAKPLQIHVVYDITASGESFVACPAYRRFANIKKWYNLLIKHFTNIDVKYILLVITT